MEFCYFCLFISYSICVIFFFVNNPNPIIENTHNIWLEIIWVVVPFIILIIIAIPSFVFLYNLDELNSPAITVKIIGHQWYWSYEYNIFTIDGDEFDFQFDS